MVSGVHMMVEFIAIRGDSLLIWMKDAVDRVPEIFNLFFLTIKLSDKKTV